MGSPDLHQVLLLAVKHFESRALSVHFSGIQLVTLVFIDTVDISNSVRNKVKVVLGDDVSILISWIIGPHPKSPLQSAWSQTIFRVHLGRSASVLHRSPLRSMVFHCTKASFS